MKVPSKTAIGVLGFFVIALVVVIIIMANECKCMNEPFSNKKNARMKMGRRNKNTRTKSNRTKRRKRY